MPWSFSLTGEGDVSLSRKHWIDFKIYLRGSSLLVWVSMRLPAHGQAQYFSLWVPHQKGKKPEVNLQRTDDTLQNKSQEGRLTFTWHYPRVQMIIATPSFSSNFRLWLI